jgi:hypothetical protein
MQPEPEFLIRGNECRILSAMCRRRCWRSIGVGVGLIEGFIYLNYVLVLIFLRPELLTRSGCQVLATSPLNMLRRTLGQTSRAALCRLDYDNSAQPFSHVVPFSLTSVPFG